MRITRLSVAAVLLITLSACADPAPVPSAGSSTTAPVAAGPAVRQARKAAGGPHKAKPTPSAKPEKTLKDEVEAGGDVPTTPVKAPVKDGVPTKGAGTFTLAGGGGGIVGGGKVLVKYRVELEDGIAWGANQAWTPTSFADAVDPILATPQGWTLSAQFPVTDAAEKLTNASWSFQRVGGSDYSVRIRLATPDTVDKLCGAVGVDTEGVYSCRFGKTIMINLRRWLRGATGFTDLPFYRTMVINHEMGHFLGFDHMLCPGAGKPAPVMQTQTIELAGCTANSYPFTEDGTFVIGPWAPS